MIPRSWACDLALREIGKLTDLLCQSPGLWPFALVAGASGLDQAVDCCRDVSLIAARAGDKLRSAGYQPEMCLPAYEDILMLLMGLRIQVRQRPLRGKRRVLQTVARDLGLTTRQAQGCLHLLSVHAVTPAYEALRA